MIDFSLMFLPQRYTMLEEKLLFTIKLFTFSVYLSFFKISTGWGSEHLGDPVIMFYIFKLWNFKTLVHSNISSLPMLYF